MFNEGSHHIPANSRNLYKMTQVNKQGKQYLVDMKNSDLLYINEFQDRLKLKEFTYARKLQYMKSNKMAPLTNGSIIASDGTENGWKLDNRNVCGICYREYSRRFGLFPKRFFCHFFLFFVCESCLSD
jgi:hypothetical protein